MKNFGKLFLSLVLVVLVHTGFAQNFLDSELNSKKTYLLLAHPTVENIQTIQFLLDQNILQLTGTEFIGVYSEEENYDYNHSVALIDDPNRHLFELSFLFHLLGGKQNIEFVPFINEKPNYFVSGFCLGLQSMNVATGGSLTQDIPAQTYQKMDPEETLKLKKNQIHRNYWPEVSTDTLLMDINFHPIQYTAHPFFPEKVNVEKIMNPLVLSSHHQSIYELGKNLIVTATSMDDEVIEAIQHRIYPNVFAVQFHPEVPDLYREGEKLKFSPDDTPKSFYEIIGEQGRAFHLKYWLTISKAIKNSIKEQQ